MCPPKNANFINIDRMKKGGLIKVKTSKPHKGGLVKDKAGRTPKTFYVKIKSKDVKPDRVPAILQANEIVIPVKYAARVKTLLKKAKIKLPNL